MIEGALDQVPWLVGLLAGLSLAAPPGPMNALIATTAAESGWRRGVRVGVAAPIADCMYLVLFWYVSRPAEQFLGHASVLRTLAILGAALMLLFAWRAARPAEEGSVAGPGAALFVALTNPYQIGWWITAGIVFVRNLGRGWAIGFILGIFGWVVLFSWLIDHGARRWTWFRPVVRWLSVVALVISAAILVAFAV